MKFYNLESFPLKQSCHRISANLTTVTGVAPSPPLLSPGCSPSWFCTAGNFSAGDLSSVWKMAVSKSRRNVCSWRNNDACVIPALLHCTSLCLEWVFRYPLKVTLCSSFCFSLLDHIWRCELSKTLRMAPQAVLISECHVNYEHWVLYLLRSRNSLWNLLSSGSQMLHLCFLHLLLRLVLFALISNFFDYV